MSFIFDLYFSTVCDVSSSGFALIILQCIPTEVRWKQDHLASVLLAISSLISFLLVS